MKANYQYKASSVSYSKQYYDPAVEYPMWKYKMETLWENVCKFFKKG